MWPHDRRLAFEGRVGLKRLSVQHPAVSDEPVDALDLSARAKVAFEWGKATAIRAEVLEIESGSIRVNAAGVYEAAFNKHRVKGKIDVPLSACQGMFDSIPVSMVPVVRGLRLAGSYSVHAEADVDTANLDRDFGLRWEVVNTCRVIDVPSSLDVVRFGGPFRRSVPWRGGEMVEVETGPGTAAWTSLGAIAPAMVAAVQTSEDAAFFRHSGFDEAAIRSSIRENLRKGEFSRGASTVTMQLAKNLYLDRRKNLSRKLQEAVLTMYLEQALTKDQILELYLNVVELGPTVYGVGQGARHYFNAAPAELSVSQAFFLSSVLPNPRAQHFGSDGALTPGWTRYLRKLMKTAHARHRLDDEALERGLRETPVFGSPTPMVVRGEGAASGDGGGDGEIPPVDAEGGPLAP
jgi:hypothetical protein